MKPSLMINISTNYAGTFFVAFAQIVTIPLYLELLGPGEWGVFSALLALSATLLMLEAGLSLFNAREFSNLAKAPVALRTLHQRLERRYLSILVGSLGVALFITPLISNRLLIEHEYRTVAVYLAFCLATAQIAGALYRSVLIGLSRQFQLNGVLILFTALRHLAGLFALKFLAEAFVLLAIFAILHAFESWVRRALAIRAIASAVEDQVVGFSAQGRPSGPCLTLAGIVGGLATHLDRLVLVRHITAEELGHYAVAATLSLALLQFLYPISTALMPVLDRFRSQQSGRTAVWSMYAVVIPLLTFVWVCAFIFSDAAIAIWLRNQPGSSAVHALFIPHLIGSTLNALSLPVYMGLLSRQQDHSIFYASALALALQACTFGFFWNRADASIGAYAWIAHNATLLLFSIFFLWLSMRK